MDNERSKMVVDRPATALLHLHLKSEDAPIDVLPSLDSAFGGESPLSFMTDCPSMSSSFLCDTSILGSQGPRRSSLGSCSSINSPEMFFTPSARTASPVTPMTNEPADYMSCPKYMKTASSLESCHPMFQLQDATPYQPDCVWFDGLSSPPGLPMMTGTYDIIPPPVNYTLYASNDLAGDKAMSNPMLTKSIFDGPLDPAAVYGVDHDLLYSPHAHAPPETIEPSVTFHRIPPSSPSYKLEPSTPMKVQVPLSAILRSSPLPIMSPPVVLTQHDVENMAYANVDHLLRFSAKGHRAQHDRLHRRGYERKREQNSKRSKVRTAGSGVTCTPVIEGNPFPCTYPGCIDKGTGKQKRFKRQEHRKRHEKTVHEKHEHDIYKCWVPECHKPFSRTDNLKSHLRNTHSKKAGVRGNRYVATLDRNSEYYDPDWQGDLDRDGYPIR
ncbi:hypothetical protein PV08_07816 [Exophiala spinifera]|uniref:C2H2-type domain-containing protein n=1 Tax=Exophiala spinifera TaxID=91928 RepID=A0A0D2BUZ8_9EURO|nr:uncharacterized protein PV08_07816 [Exophiala spinifera]KIW15029.1 hypothetical protein PV08_07816 [Exophiala spinifera]